MTKENKLAITVAAEFIVIQGLSLRAVCYEHVDIKEEVLETLHLQETHGEHVLMHGIPELLSTKFSWNLFETTQVFIMFCTLFIG